MHKSSMLRMEWFEKNYSSKIKTEKIKVLDVGSFDVNGSYKQFFLDKKYEYYGLDMEKGPNVDIVLKSPYDWSKIADDSYDVIISGQAFEHIEFFWITIAEMVRVLKKDGLLCIVAPNGFKEHRFPVDCWRFFTDGMIALARYTSLNIIHAHTNCAPAEQEDWYSDRNADSILIAQKPYSGSTIIVDLKSYVCQPANLELLRSGLMPYHKRYPLKTVLMTKIKSFLRIIIKKQ